MIYLAQPYYDPDEFVRQWRYTKACQMTARFIRDGRAVYSPVMQLHPLVVSRELEPNQLAWNRVSKDMIARCDEIVVLHLPGWQESICLRADLHFAGECEKPVRHFELPTQKFTMTVGEQMCLSNGTLIEVLAAPSGGKRLLVRVQS